MNARTLLSLASFLAVVLVPLHTSAESPAFPPTINLQETELVKVGEGSYSWMWFKLYDGALYLEDEHRDADPLGDRIRRLELAYARDLKADAFRESGRRILEDSLSSAEWVEIKERLERLHAAFQPVKAGDRYALTYLPGEGTTLSLNGVPLVTIPGADFARAYFSIWLGENPAKAAFRDQLLGDSSP